MMKSTIFGRKITIYCETNIKKHCIIDTDKLLNGVIFLRKLTDFKKAIQNVRLYKGKCLWIILKIKLMKF